MNSDRYFSRRLNDVLNQLVGLMQADAFSRWLDARCLCHLTITVIIITRVQKQKSGQARQQHLTSSSILLIEHTM